MYSYQRAYNFTAKRIKEVSMVAMTLTPNPESNLHNDDTLAEFARVSSEPALSITELRATTTDTKENLQLLDCFLPCVTGCRLPAVVLYGHTWQSKSLLECTQVSTLSYVDDNWIDCHLLMLPAMY